jgi:hypothetical protein
MSKIVIAAALSAGKEHPITTAAPATATPAVPEATPLDAAPAK